MKLFKNGLLLLAVVSAFFLISCSSDNNNNNNNDDNNGGGTTPQTGLSFSPVAFPSTDLEKRQILASDTATVDGIDYSIGYNTILRSGQKAADSDTYAFGTLVDQNGDAIQVGGEDWISDSNDFASLLHGADGNLYMVSHFENSPAAMYITELTQDLGTGQITPVRSKPIDYSSFYGGWVHCAGSVTPWGTHLGSEEYEPNAEDVDPVTGHFNDYYGFAQAYYFGLDPNDTTADFTSINPYFYGYQIEVAVQDYSNYTATKHYTLGRVAHELAYVMPDQQTVYISDDGTNVGLFMFKADTAGDLSAGTLYVAKWHQTSDENGGSADLTWVDLGHATDAEVRAYIDTRPQFTDIFNQTDPIDSDGDGNAYECPADYTSVNTTMGHECLDLVDGMETMASRLETRRYAAYLGGTTEFRKMEGITHNPDTNTMYLALSAIERGMEDFARGGEYRDSYDKGGYNDITVPYNGCGGVYALALDDNYTAQNIQGLVIGEMMDYTGTEYEGNSCHIDNLANPDNVTFIPGYDTLIIGEDTGSGHQNDVIWSYNLTDATLTRIQTTPYGSETTSPYFYPNINGYGYLMSVVQHPYGESDEDQVSEDSDERRAYTGYIGPFPAMD